MIWLVQASSQPNRQFRPWRERSKGALTSSACFWAVLLNPLRESLRQTARVLRDSLLGCQSMAMKAGFGGAWSLSSVATGPGFLGPRSSSADAEMGKRRLIWLPD